jgi:hypothetical protein
VAQGEVVEEEVFKKEADQEQSGNDEAVHGELSPQSVSFEEDLQHEPASQVGACISSRAWKTSKAEELALESAPATEYNLDRPATAWRTKNTKINGTKAKETSSRETDSEPQELSNVNESQSEYHHNHEQNAIPNVSRTTLVAEKSMPSRTHPKAAFPEMQASVEDVEDEDFMTGAHPNCFISFEDNVPDYAIKSNLPALSTLERSIKNESKKPIKSTDGHPRAGPGQASRAGRELKSNGLRYRSLSRDLGTSSNGEPYLGDDEEEHRSGLQSNPAPTGKLYSKRRVVVLSPISAEDFCEAPQKRPATKHRANRKGAVWGSASEREEEERQKRRQNHIASTGKLHSKPGFLASPPISAEDFRETLQKLPAPKHMANREGAVWGSASEREEMERQKKERQKQQRRFSKFKAGSNPIDIGSLRPYSWVDYWVDGMQRKNDVLH